MLAPFFNIKRGDIINKRFGRLKDGFYLISEKKKDSDGNKVFTFLNSKNKEEIPIAVNDKDKIPKINKDAKREE